MKKILILLIVTLSVISWSVSFAGPSILSGSPGAGSEDPTTNAVATVDYEHKEIHTGNHFFYTDFNTLASGATAEYVFTTPNTTKWAHMIFSLTGSSITEIYLFEDTLKSGVSLVTPLNSNRNSSTASTCTLYKNATDQASGTTLYALKSGSATNQSRTPMASNRNEEIILKQNTKYLFRILSGAADNLTNIQLEWYEHTNK